VPFSLEQKKAVVAEVAEVARSAHSAVAAEYRGLTVAEMTRLREQARGAGVYLKVVRNTLARRAVEGTSFECMQDGFKGPLVLAFAREDPGASARVVRDFAKDHAKLVARMIAFDGRLYDGARLESFARLPTREQALSQLLAVMKAPVSQLARTIAEPHARLVRTLGAIRDGRQAA